MSKVNISTKLPWFLLLGAPHAGKSALLGQAGFRLLEPQPSETEVSKQCTWWFNTEAAVLDVPGHYLDHIEQFLQLLRHYVRRKSFGGVLVTLDLSNWGLLNKTGQQEITSKLKETLTFLQKKGKTTCPIYLILTKSDRIIGFREFFAHLAPEERIQTLGFDLTERPFKTQLENLIKDLHANTIRKIHQEHNSQKRSLIPYFPLQLESFKESLAQLIQELPPIKGVYFTSSLQQEAPIDYLNENTLSILTMATSPATSALHLLPATQRAYFTRQLFKKIAGSLYSKGPSRAPKILSFCQKNWRYIAYGAIISLAVAYSSWAIYSFKNKMATINSAQQALAAYKVTAQQLTASAAHSLNQTLPALNLLQQATHALNQTHFPWLITHYSQQKNLPALASQAYHQALVNYFLPNLGALIEQPLRSNSDPVLLYGALKAYLMLGDPSHFNSGFIKSWLLNYWQQTFTNNPGLRAQLATHLNALLAHPIPPLELNQQVIASTRRTLASIPPLELAYAILKNRVGMNTVNILPADNKQQAAFNAIFATAPHSTELPNLYIADQFNDVYFTKIKQACATALNSDWVIGRRTQAAITSDNDPTLDALTKKVQAFYLQDYANRWLALLTNIQIAPWKSWQQADATLHYLTDVTSPLSTLLKTISTNIAILPSIQPISADNLSQATPAISKLQQYLQKIETGKESNNAAFLATKEALTQPSNKANPIYQLQELATRMPSPLREWMSSIASNSWRLLLDQTAQYLDARWQSQVADFYNHQLANRYPLAKNSSQDIQLADFTLFFASDGMFNQYFKIYLAPYLDTQRTEWRWRNLGGQTLVLAPNLLAQLERAAIVRSMFFGNDQQLRVNFSLQLISLGPDVKQITLTLNDKTITGQLNDKAAHSVSWPGIDNITLTFTNNNGQQVTTNYKGPWAWFRLLDKANLQPVKGTQEFELTFDLNGNAARYQLQAQQAINPFIAGIIEQFRCPDRIT